MRYEAKHSYFKKMAQAMGSFINLLYSLAIRHQQLECFNNVNVTDIPGDNMEIGPGTSK